MNFAYPTYMTRLIKDDSSSKANARQQIKQRLSQLKARENATRQQYQPPVYNKSGNTMGSNYGQLDAITKAGSRNGLHNGEQFGSRNRAQVMQRRSSSKQLASMSSTHSQTIHQPVLSHRKRQQRLSASRGRGKREGSVPSQENLATSRKTIKNSNRDSIKQLDSGSKKKIQKQGPQVNIMTPMTTSNKSMSQQRMLSTTLSNKQQQYQQYRDLSRTISSQKPPLRTSATAAMTTAKKAFTNQGSLTSISNGTRKQSKTPSNYSLGSKPSRVIKIPQRLAQQNKAMFQHQSMPLSGNKERKTSNYSEKLKKMHQQTEPLQKRQYSQWKAVSQKSQIENTSQDLSACCEAVSACNLTKSYENTTNSPFDRARNSNKSHQILTYHSNNNFDKQRGSHNNPLISYHSNIIRTPEDVETTQNFGTCGPLDKSISHLSQTDIQLNYRDFHLQSQLRTTTEGKNTTSEDMQIHDTSFNNNAHNETVITPLDLPEHPHHQYTQHSLPRANHRQHYLGSDDDQPSHISCKNFFDQLVTQQLNRDKKNGPSVNNNRMNTDQLRQYQIMQDAKRATKQAEQQSKRRSRTFTQINPGKDHANSVQTDSLDYQTAPGEQTQTNTIDHQETTQASNLEKRPMQTLTSDGLESTQAKNLMVQTFPDSPLQPMMPGVSSGNNNASFDLRHGLHPLKKQAKVISTSQYKVTSNKRQVAPVAGNSRTMKAIREQRNSRKALISERKSNTTDKENKVNRGNKAAKSPVGMKDRPASLKMTTSAGYPIQNKSCPVTRKSGVKRQISNHWNHIYQEQKNKDSKALNLGLVKKSTISPPISKKNTLRRRGNDSQRLQATQFTRASDLEPGNGPTSTSQSNTRIPPSKRKEHQTHTESLNQDQFENKHFDIANHQPGQQRLETCHTNHTVKRTMQNSSLSYAADQSITVDPPQTVSFANSMMHIQDDNITDDNTNDCHLQSQMDNDGAMAQQQVSPPPRISDLNKSSLLVKVEHALTDQAEDNHKVYESKLLACMQDLTPQNVFEQLLQSDYAQCDKKKQASLLKAAKSLCLGLQLMNMDKKYENPKRMLAKMSQCQQYIKDHFVFLQNMLSYPIQHLDSFTFRFSENQPTTLDTLHIECLLDQVFGKMVLEIIEKGKSSKLINSPRVRNTESKIFFSFGYFSMMYSLVLIKNRFQMMNFYGALEKRNPISNFACSNICTTDDDEAEEERKLQPVAKEEKPMHPKHLINPSDEFQRQTQQQITEEGETEEPKFRSMVAKKISETLKKKFNKDIKFVPNTNEDYGFVQSRAQAYNSDLPVTQETLNNTENSKQPDQNACGANNGGNISTTRNNSFLQPSDDGGDTGGNNTYMMFDLRITQLMDSQINSPYEPQTLDNSNLNKTNEPPATNTTAQNETVCQPLEQEQSTDQQQQQIVKIPCAQQSFGSSGGSSSSCLERDDDKTEDLLNDSRRSGELWNPELPSNSVRNVSQIVENSKNLIDILDSCTKYGVTSNHMSFVNQKTSEQDMSNVKSSQGGATPVEPCIFINKRGGGIRVDDLLNTFKVKSNFDTMAKSSKSKSKKRNKNKFDESDEKNQHAIQTFDQNPAQITIQGEEERFNTNQQHSLTERLIEPPNINDLRIEKHLVDQSKSINEYDDSHACIEAGCTSAAIAPSNTPQDTQPGQQHLEHKMLRPRVEDNYSSLIQSPDAEEYPGCCQPVQITCMSGSALPIENLLPTNKTLSFSNDLWSLCENCCQGGQFNQSKQTFDSKNYDSKYSAGKSRTPDHQLLTTTGKCCKCNQINEVHMVKMDNQTFDGNRETDDNMNSKPATDTFQSLQTQFQNNITENIKELESYSGPKIVEEAEQSSSNQNNRKEGGRKYNQSQGQGSSHHICSNSQDNVKKIGGGDQTTNLILFNDGGADTDNSKIQNNTSNQTQESLEFPQMHRKSKTDTQVVDQLCKNAKRPVVDDLYLEDDGYDVDRSEVPGPRLKESVDKANDASVNEDGESKNNNNEEKQGLELKQEYVQQIQGFHQIQSQHRKGRNHGSRSNSDNIIIKSEHKSSRKYLQIYDNQIGSKNRHEETFGQPIISNAQIDSQNTETMLPGTQPLTTTNVLSTERQDRPQFVFPPSQDGMGQLQLLDGNHSKRNTYLQTERSSIRERLSQADKLSAAIEQVTNYMISDPYGPQIGQITNRSTNLSHRKRNSAKQFQDKSNEKQQVQTQQDIQFKIEPSSFEKIDEESTPEAANPSKEMPEPADLPEKQSYKTFNLNSISIETDSKCQIRTVATVERVKTVERMISDVMNNTRSEKNEIQIEERQSEASKSNEVQKVQPPQSKRDENRERSIGTIIREQIYQKREERMQKEKAVLDHLLNMYTNMGNQQPNFCESFHEESHNKEQLMTADFLQENALQSYDNHINQIGGNQGDEHYMSFSQKTEMILNRQAHHQAAAMVAAGQQHPNLDTPVELKFLKMKRQSLMSLQSNDMVNFADVHNYHTTNNLMNYSLGVISDHQFNEDDEVGNEPLPESIHSAVPSERNKTGPSSVVQSSQPQSPNNEAQNITLGQINKIKHKKLESNRSTATLGSKCTFRSQDTADLQNIIHNLEQLKQQRATSGERLTGSALKMLTDQVIDEKMSQISLIQGGPLSMSNTMMNNTTTSNGNEPNIFFSAGVGENEQLNQDIAEEINLGGTTITNNRLISKLASEPLSDQKDDGHFQALGLRAQETCKTQNTKMEINIPIIFDQPRGSKSSKNSRKSQNLKYTNLENVQRQRDLDRQVLERAKKLKEIMN